MIHSDFHLHTSHSSDSQASMESMILRAIELSLNKICFTEHQDFDYPENKENLDFLVDLPSFKSELLSLKDKYNDRIQILFGAEVGFHHRFYSYC